MSFYNYGQTQGDGALGGILKGGEDGFTFAQGVKSMLQKRKLDAQKAGDEHAQAGITAATDMKSAGLAYAPTPSPTTGGGPVQPGTDPSNQPREGDGATEVGATTPLPSGVSNPTPQPGLFGKVGKLLHLGGGGSHDDTGQNAGSHVTDQFVDTGPMEAERNTIRTQAGETSRSAATNATSVQTNQLTNDTSANNEASREANELAIAKLHNDMELRVHSQDKGMQQSAARASVLQRQLHSIDVRLSGMWGQPTMDPATKAQLQSERSNTQTQLEMEMGYKPGTLHASTADPSEGQSQVQSPFPGGQNLYGGPNPPATDNLWQKALKDAGIIR